MPQTVSTIDVVETKPQECPTSFEIQLCRHLNSMKNADDMLQLCVCESVHFTIAMIHSYRHGLAGVPRRGFPGAPSSASSGPPKHPALTAFQSPGSPAHHPASGASRPQSPPSRYCGQCWARTAGSVGNDDLQCEASTNGQRYMRLTLGGSLM